MARSKMVDLWFKKAGRDLRFAKAALTLEEQFFDEIVFHCQQAVEKAIKGYLAHFRIPFDKTHDIGLLLIEVAKIDAELALLLENAKILTKYAVTIRYPDASGVEMVIDKDVVNRSISIAEAVSVVLTEKTSK